MSTNDEKRRELLLHAHVYADELAFLLGVDESALAAFEIMGAIPESEPDYLLGSSRRRWPLGKTLDQWSAHHARAATFNAKESAKGDGDARP